MKYRRQLHAALSVLFLAAGVHAGALKDNPVTQGDDVVPLTHFHPAFGAITPAAALAYVIPVQQQQQQQLETPLDGAITTATTSFKQTDVKDLQVLGVVGTGEYRRQLEASSSDLARLESHFGASMERNIDTLKKYGTASFNPAPWPSSYWPVYADGINYRWAGADVPSPSEKYATAFGIDTKKLTDAVSKNNGIDSQDYRYRCSKNEDCTVLKDNSMCGIRRGESSGYCIPTWFGVCHAWAPAAILEPEPKCAVTRGSTTFQPFDIKALLTQIYDGARVPTVFTGARFNGPDSPENKDKYGRFTDAARRDLGPGFFHIAIHNIMGKFKRSFVVDVTAGSEVWNQPVRSYDVVELTPMTLVQGAQTYFGVDTYPFNSDAVSLVYVHTKFRWIVEAVEDGPLVDSSRVDAHTTTGDFTYLLELDAQNNIIGGEWVGDSRSNHPDFLWLPTSRPGFSTVTDVGLSYQLVRELLDASIKCADTEPTPAPAPSPEPLPTPTPSSSPSAAPTPTPSPLSNDECATPAWGSCGTQNSLRCCPSGQYCQAWDSWNYQCLDIPMTCPQQFTNIDLFGNDLFTLYGLSPADCCTQCSKTAGCKAYTFVNENSNGITACYLKSSAGGHRTSGGAVSGILA